MEFRIIFERNEIDRVFSGLGMIFTHLINRPQGVIPGDPDAMIDARGIIRNVAGEMRIGGGQRPAVRSMADFADAMARFQASQETPLLPARAEGEHEHRYAYLQTERGQDIYVCREEGCERRLAIPGRIIEPAPLQEIPEVTEHEERSEDEQPELPGLPPGEREEDPGTHTPPG